MLTLNADIHPLMNRMHKPDPKLGPDRQDKPVSYTHLTLPTSDLV